MRKHPPKKHTQTHSHTPASRQSFLLHGTGDGNTVRCKQVFSARVHAEQLNAMRAPVEADSGVKDQGPDVGDEEILRLVFLHVLKLELGELLFAQKQKEERNFVWIHKWIKEAESDNPTFLFLTETHWHFRSRLFSLSPHSKKN